MKSTRFDLVTFYNEEGFNDGWTILEINKSDLHVLWQSDAFETKEEAEKYFNEEFEGETLNVIE